MVQINIIVGCDAENGIGYQNKIPWYISSDMKYFKEMTCHVSPGKVNAVLMGRKTWDSLPAKYRPLPHRLNIILSKTSSMHSSPASGLWIQSFSQIQDILQKYEIETLWIIGGASVYTQALQHLPIHYIYKTHIHKKFVCDTWFSFPKEQFTLYKTTECIEKDGTILQFEVYKKNGQHVLQTGITNMSVNNEENQYLDLIKHILNNGSIRKDRTGVGTLSVFGTQMRFNIRNTLPLFTTKRVFFRGIVEELLWFLRGDTNVRILQDKNVKIWNGNSTPEYLESVGLSHLKNGDLGPIYGFQWRHFGAKYTTGDADYTGKGVDQIAKIIHQIKHEPHSRRIILSAWNPVDLDHMALPPCHVLYQFYVNNGELSCHMYQRSGDIGLGVPFNIASSSILTYILAHLTNLVPGELIHSIGDAHIYTSHIEALKEQCTRIPRPFPTLHISTHKQCIEDIQYSDFMLENYSPYPSIKMRMAV